MTLKISPLKISNLSSERKSNRMHSSEYKGHVRPNQKINEHIIRIPEQEREIGREAMFEEIMAETFQN